MPLQLTKHEVISLKNHPGFSEKWLHDAIAGDPSILGLGDVEVIDRERIQEHSGRLDLLLSDGDSTRYEVEIMLGRTDPSHIIRCIEYWDIERRRYPGYEHIAVLIAEDITSRFLNILSLMAGNIPLIAVQLNALKVGQHLVLDFVHVLNQTSLRRDDESESGGQEVDRSHWDAKVGSDIMAIVDGVLALTNDLAEGRFELKYLKGHIGISEPGNWRNASALNPKRRFVHYHIPVGDADKWAEQIENLGLPVIKRRQNRMVRLTLTPQQFKEHGEFLRELIEEGLGQYQYTS